MNDTPIDGWLPYEELVKSIGPSVQCSCGRFAKYLRTEKGFNGSYSTETMFVDCTRCGKVRIELV